MHTKISLPAVVAVFAVVAPASWLHGQGADLPVSFGRPDVLPLAAIDLQTLPAVNVTALLAEDAQFEDLLHVDRVGAWIKTDLSPANAGTWEDLPEGGQLWRVQVVSTGALWLAPAFGTFRLPSGARMWVYDPLYEQVEGGFGIDDVRPHGQRAVAPLSDQHVVVELHWPEPLRGQTANLHMGAMFHGYKPLFPADGPCEEDCSSDTSCDLDLGIDDIKRGVVRIAIPIDQVQSGFGRCTGTLINNTGDPCRQFVITAGHCITNIGLAELSTFIYNYERPGCCTGEPPDEDHQDRTAGATWIAEWDITLTPQGQLTLGPGSDMALLEVDERIPAFFNVYFNGWDRTGSVGGQTGTIHLPAGTQSRKVTWSLDPYVVANQRFWRVDVWTDGHIKPGSSGASLITGVDAPNPGRIVGQLAGGATGTCDGLPTGTPCGGDGDCQGEGGDCMESCPGVFSLFGRLDASWNGGGSPTTRLRDWLDLGSTQALVLAGREQINSVDCATEPWANWLNTNQDNGGNGAPDPGETVTFSPVVANLGTDPLTGVSGTIVSLTPGVTVVTGTATWPDIPGETSLEPAMPMQIQIGDSVPCGAQFTVRLDLTATSGSGAWSPEMTLRVGEGASTSLAGFGGFTSSSLLGSNMFVPDSADDTPLGQRWFIADTPTTSDTALTSPLITNLPPDATLRFRHMMDAENLYGGGLLEYLVPGGAWTDAASLITAGHYGSGLNRGVPADVKGRNAWGGDSDGWQDVEVDLGSLSGGDVMLRWRFATDDSGGDVGWWIDDAVIETTTFACACPSDLDGDGVVGVLDFLQLLADWGPCAGCVSDIDGDGTVGVLDFLALLGDWGACP